MQRLLTRFSAKNISALVGEKISWWVIAGYVLAASTLADILMPSGNVPNAYMTFWPAFIATATLELLVWQVARRLLLRSTIKQVTRDRIARWARLLGWLLLFLAGCYIAAGIWIGIELSTRFPASSQAVLSLWAEKSIRQAWVLLLVLLGLTLYLLSIFWRLFRRFERWRIAIAALFIPFLLGYLIFISGIFAAFSSHLNKDAAKIAGMAPSVLDAGRYNEAPGYVFMWLIVFAIATGIAMSTFARIRNREDKLLIASLEADKQRERVGRELAEAQLKLLQAQIEPHFLFNTLGAVQQRAEGKAPEAAALAGDLIHFLRNSMQSLRAERTTLGEDGQLVAAYLSVMQARLGSRLQYAVQIPAELTHLPIPNLMLLTLVENALKHGIEPHPAGGAVQVKAQLANAYLQLTVADTGRGVSDLPGSGVGLSNIRARLRMIYGEAARLVLEENEPQGFVASIQLPLVAEVQA